MSLSIWMTVGLALYIRWLWCAGVIVLVLHDTCAVLSRLVLCMACVLFLKPLVSGCIFEGTMFWDGGYHSIEC